MYKRECHIKDHIFRLQGTKQPSTTHLTSSAISGVQQTMIGADGLIWGGRTDLGRTDGRAVIWGFGTADGRIWAWRTDGFGPAGRTDLGRTDGRTRGLRGSVQADVQRLGKDRRAG